MCECGCGDLRPIGKLRAKGGWYAVELYPGCSDCATGWGLGVTYLKNADEDTKWMLESVPEISFDERGQWRVPVLEPSVLRKLIAEHTENPADWNSETHFAIDQFLSRDGLRKLYRESSTTSGAEMK